MESPNKVFLEAIDFDLCEYVLDSSFVLNNFINNEVVNKPNYGPHKKN